MELTSSTQPEHRQSLLWSMNLSLVVGVLMLVMKVVRIGSLAPRLS